MFVLCIRYNGRLGQKLWHCTHFKATTQRIFPSIVATFSPSHPQRYRSCYASLNWFNIYSDSGVSYARYRVIIRRPLGYHFGEIWTNMILFFRRNAFETAVKKVSAILSLTRLICSLASRGELLTMRHGFSMKSFVKSLVLEFISAESVFQCPGAFVPNPKLPQFCVYGGVLWWLPLYIWSHRGCSCIPNHWNHLLMYIVLKILVRV